jgi:HD-GYP domain-containing protein (c-di-GMP phosphodiesterase class II)
MVGVMRVNAAIGGVVLLALAVACAAAWQAIHGAQRPLSLVDLVVLLAMLLFVIAMDSLATRIRQLQFNAIFTVAGAIFVAAAVGYGALVGIMLAAIGTLTTELIAGREMKKLIFNVGEITCATGVAGLTYHMLAGPDARVPLASLNTMLAAICASMLYLLVNAVLFAVVVGIATGRSPVVMFAADIRNFLLQNITLQSIALILTTLPELSPWALVIILLPLFGPFIAMRGQRETLQQIQQTIEALADMVDRRDVTTAQHSERVAQYTQQIIDELGNVRFAEAEAIILAARVHDLGKIAIPDAVLLKPGRLDEEEYRLMRYHPVAGDEVLNKLSIYKASLGVVRHHHERYDGKGYPDGMKGEEIPLGARIVGIADTYDVITSDRPYHRARSVREATEELINCKGTQFDPMIVDAFIRVLERTHGIIVVPEEPSESAPVLVPVGAPR